MTPHYPMKHNNLITTNSLQESQPSGVLTIGITRVLLYTPTTHFMCYS